MRADNASKSIAELETERTNLKDKLFKYKTMEKY